MRNRIEVLHGVNLDTLGRRDPEHYGTITLPELELSIKRFAAELELEVRFFQSNHEGEFVDYLHRLPDLADAAVLNAGAWTHYSLALYDACAQLTAPLVEVHISDPSQRPEEFRHTSVVTPHAIEVITGQGIDGYRLALERIAAEIQ